MATKKDPSAGRTPDTGSWIHGCFVVRVGTDFSSYKAILEYALQDEVYKGGGKPQLDPAVKKVLSSKAGDDGPLPLYYTKRKCRDTSLGGNDSINPLPQFSVDDDIAHPWFYEQTGTNVSMGQVYSENYDDLQQILYLGFGIPVFSNVGSFWANAADKELTDFINKGSSITAEKIGNLIGTSIVAIMQIATIPFKFIGAIWNALTQVQISKYYSFSSQMPMYFRFVNTILVHLATNMNIVGSNDSMNTTGSVTSGTTQMKLLDQGTRSTQDLSGMSAAFREHGLDMARIMTKKFFYENGNQSTLKNRFTDQALFEASKLNGPKGVSVEAEAPTNESTNTTGPDAGSSSPRTWTDSLFDSFKAAYQGTSAAIFDGHLFIGFRIDKGMGGSESFSNATGESEISRKANEQFQIGREAAFQTMSGNMGDGAIASAFGAAMNAATGLFNGLASAIKMDPLAAAMSGGARIDIPEVWMSSSWSRSASFSITCLAPYGDFESIFQSEYVPLACIMAGALPRGTGLSSHSSPFVCQAYCRGVFSSPLCMIESLEVTRGADQFGMNAARLPLKLTMNVTLKDLSPVMYLNMGGDKGIAQAIFGNDDNFSEYMMTLSGMGLKDRLSLWRSMKRKFQILVSTIRKNRLNPYMISMDIGNSSAGRLISSFISDGRNLPGN